MWFNEPMPMHRGKNEDFFKAWTADMAYVLGFFAADGSMYRTRRNTCFIEFQITDKELLYRIRRALGSGHAITERPARRLHAKPVYRLQIGSKEWFADLCELGFLQNKSLVARLPAVPDDFMADFLRGYFDGDGNVMFGYYRKPGRDYSNRVLSLRFTSGSRLLLQDIKLKLEDILAIRGSLYFSGGGWRLNYSTFPSKILGDFIYHNGNLADLIYLPRKYRIFQVAKNAAVAQFG